MVKGKKIEYPDQCGQFEKRLSLFLLFVLESNYRGFLVSRPQLNLVCHGICVSPGQTTGETTLYGSYVLPVIIHYIVRVTIL